MRFQDRVHKVIKFVKCVRYAGLLFIAYCLLVLSLSNGLLAVAPARAQTPPPVKATEGVEGAIEASPVFTEVVLEAPGETEEIELLYKNNSDETITLEIFPIDFRQADLTGAVNFLGVESGSFSYSLSSFLSFESNTISLDPGQERVFKVAVTNRADMSPGGHYAAVIARLRPDFAKDSSGTQGPGTQGPGGQGPIGNQNTSLSEVSDLGRASVAPSISSLILLRKVGGERFNLSLSDSAFPDNFVVFNYPLTIISTFRNEGNIHLVPFGRAEVKDIFGRVLYKGIVNASSLRVFPETRRYINIEMSRTAWSFPISVNTFTIKGEDSLKKTKYAYQESFVYINPWFGGGVVILAILLIRFREKFKKFRLRLRIVEKKGRKK